jgi:hypothetical protein
MSVPSFSIIYVKSSFRSLFLRTRPVFCFHALVLFFGWYVCIVWGLHLSFLSLGCISFWASFFDLVDLFLKVCARYRGRGGWQPGPEIIWLLLRHEASRGVVTIIVGHAVWPNNTLALLGLRGYLRIRIPFVTFPVSLLCTQGRLSIRWTLCSFNSSVIPCEYNWPK